MVMVLGDNLRRNKPAIATYVIATLCIISFFLVANIELLAFVPLGFSLHPALSFYRLITAQFLHANLLHLSGNLVFLLAFGRSIENLIGTRLFAVTYVGLGALSFLGSWLIGPDSRVPIIGASGALSFLLGAYTAVFPFAKLRIIPFLRRPYLRTWFFAGAWLALQLWDMATVGETVSGVAYATHLGGFLIGIAAGIAWKEFALDTDRLIGELTQGEQR